MDSITDFHHQRIRDLLLRRSTRRTAAADAVTSALGARTNPLHIPELLWCIVACTPPRVWPSLCLVSRLWCQVLQPLLWRHISLRTNNSLKRAERLAPFLSTHGHHIRKFDLAMPIGSHHAAPFLKSLSSTLYPALTSLLLQGLRIRTNQLVDVLQQLPRLTAINLQYSRLSVHPLNLLAHHSLLESIAFTQDKVLLEPTHTNIFRSWPCLKDLSITICEDLVEDDPALLLQKAIVESDLQLQSLELKDLPYSEATVSHLIANSPGMQKLWLRNCNVPVHHLATTPPTSLVSLQLLSQITLDALVVLLKANAGLRHLEISLDSLLPDRLATLCPALQVLRLERADSFATSPAVILKNFPQLRRLHIFDVHLSWSELCLEGACQLEELTFDAIIQAKNPPMRKRSQGTEEPQDAFWTSLGRLTRLRRLTLNFMIPYCTKLPKGVRQIQSLSRLEHLALFGSGEWTFDDVQWLAESFVDLEELRCRSTEMSTPLWSWLRTNWPGLELRLS